MESDLPELVLRRSGDELDVIELELQLAVDIFFVELVQFRVQLGRVRRRRRQHRQLLTGAPTANR
ncbi:hypothetical protein [Mycobacteroides chelonae]|uniref:hypothetical protein n=1 Tax=Mycobacteroides chelonae TaxID=1774 RepID=UPI0008AA4B69|nr:hypothetical protein [Mycobacteroides chelonae]OHU12931.1 hypothetical protein BKG75_18145 [Mycobacteroides chelonae]